MREILIVAGDKPADLDPGPAPMLQWVRIDRLVIDDSYQRDLKAKNWTAIRAIAKKFKWSRFSPVFCAPIPGGRFAIIDGQHRTHAAAICGFEEVPCQIVQMSPEEQAESFAAVNGAVTKITSLQLFKAALSAGESWAVEANTCAKDAGCRLMLSNYSAEKRQPGMIFGPHAFRDVIKLRSAEAVTAALKVVKAAEGYGDVQEIWDMGILAPLLLALAEHPEFLASSRAKAMLEGFDIWAAHDAIIEEVKRKRRMALPCATRRELLAQAISAAIAKAVAK